MTPPKNISGSERDNEDGAESGPKPKRPRYVSNACYHRPSRHDGGGAPARPHITDPLPGFEDAYNTREREWHQMATQIRTVMDKVDSLPDKLSTMSPTSPLAQRAVVRTQELQEPADLRAQPANAPQLDGPEATDTSLQPSVRADSGTTFPEYHGPTSSEFTFEVASESLTELGVGCAFSKSNQSTRLPSFPCISRSPSAGKALLSRLLVRDPLWTIERSDALRYFDTYHRTVGAMYPVTSGPHFAHKVQTLLDTLDVARGRRYRGGFGHLIELMFSPDTQLLKIQLAIGMITELGPSGTEMAAELMQTVLDSSDDSFMNVEGLKGVQIHVLTVRLPSSDLPM
ncbi:hypothetical protein LTS15_007596 [Exophiala xenobiotica]|nr:hypothetical protein LTS15_007596 [Exophiala xenobiotica]